MRTLTVLSLAALLVFAPAFAENPVTKTSTTQITLEDKERLPEINIEDVRNFVEFTAKVAVISKEFYLQVWHTQRECWIAQINLDRKIDSHIRNTIWYAYNESFWEKWRVEFTKDNPASVESMELRSTRSYSSLCAIPEYWRYVQDIMDTKLLYHATYDQLCKEFDRKKSDAWLRFQDKRELIAENSKTK